MQARLAAACRLGLLLHAGLAAAFEVQIIRLLVAGLF
jgi:hypothetical protein